MTRDNRNKYPHVRVVVSYTLDQTAVRSDRWFKKYEYFTYSIVGVRTAADYQSKINSGQQETADINIHACAWLLATHWIKRRSALTIGSKNMNILPFNGGGGGLPN